jgi:hypothetical protein
MLNKIKIWPTKLFGQCNGIASPPQEVPDAFADQSFNEKK